MIDKSAASSSVHFAFADALRAVAIISVVLSHIVMVMPFLSTIEPFRGAMGSIGVDVFFVLSGFLLGRPYVDAVLGRAALPNWKRYALRRFLRIWPAYAFVVFLTVAKAFGHHGFDSFMAADAVTHLLMIHDFFPQFAGGVDNVSLWTMAVDAQFYVILPIAGWLLFKGRESDRKASVFRTIAIAFVASTAYRIVAAFVLPQTVDYELSYDRNVIGMGSSFAAGVLLASLDAFGIVCSPRDAKRFLLASVAFAVACFAISYLVPDSVRLRGWLMDATGTAAVATLIFAVRQVNRRTTNRMLGSSVVTFVAANAYALYLLHVPIKMTVITFLAGHRSDVHSNAYGVIFALLFCGACAIFVPLLHYFVERPFLTMKERARTTPIATGSGAS